MEIRFAAIPKCASRSLKALGLLGELEGRCHTRITEYPGWESFRWMAVDRDPAAWYASWWAECRRTRSQFAGVFGFEYTSIEEDLERLRHPERVSIAPRRPGLNAWIPETFLQDYATYLRSGRGFKEYCFDVITDGVPCERIDILSLDTWLLENGFSPVHMNKREAENA